MCSTCAQLTRWIRGDGCERRSADGLIKPWMTRYKKLRRIFCEVLDTHAELTGKEINDETASLALPGSSITLDVVPVASGKTLGYEVTRTMRPPPAVVGGASYGVSPNTRLALRLSILSDTATRHWRRRMAVKGRPRKGKAAGLR